MTSELGWLYPLSPALPTPAVTAWMGLVSLLQFSLSLKEIYVLDDHQALFQL